MAEPFGGSVTTATREDVLETALRYFVQRDLMNAATYLEPVGWTPMTIEFACRLRELNRLCGLWGEEPEVIRRVLDEPAQ
jgi:hypothetical protein